MEETKNNEDIQSLLSHGLQLPEASRDDVFFYPNVPQGTQGVKDSIFRNRENNTENPKYDIIREQGGSTDGADILHEIDNGEDSTRAGEQAQRMGESAASLEERRSSCDRIRETDTVKRRVYETAEEKITLDVIEDTSLPEASKLRIPETEHGMKARLTVCLTGFYP